jgi:hypothetical protein
MSCYGGVVTVTGGRLRGFVLRAALVVLAALGVLLMHSVPMLPSASHQAMSAAAASTVLTNTEHYGSEAHGLAVSSPIVAEPEPRPSGHEMAHPCMATPVSWPAMSVPSGVVDAPLAPDAVSARVIAVMSQWGRAPPWAVSSLDESVLLRV